MVQKKSPAAGAETLVAEPPVKDTGTSADRPGGGAQGGAKRSAADSIRDEASKIGSQAKDKARAYATEGKDKATGALDEVAKLMQSAANDVDERIGPEYGRYARSAADGISGFAEALRGKQVDDLLDDATAFVKKSPVVAIGAAAAIGFVLARLIKSGIDAAADLADRDDDKPSKA